jgi:hypothetical protein
MLIYANEKQGKSVSDVLVFIEIYRKQQGSTVNFILIVQVLEK